MKAYSLCVAWETSRTLTSGKTEAAVPWGLFFLWLWMVDEVRGESAHLITAITSTLIAGLCASSLQRRDFLWVQCVSHFLVNSVRWTFSFNFCIFGSFLMHQNVSLLNSYVKKISLMNDAKMTKFWILQCYYYVITTLYFIN